MLARLFESTVIKPFVMPTPYTIELSVFGTDVCMFKRKLPDLSLCIVSHESDGRKSHKKNVVPYLSVF